MSTTPQRRGLHTAKALAALAVATLGEDDLRLFASLVRLMAEGDRDGAAIVIEALFAAKGAKAPADILEAVRPGWASVERV